MAELLGFRLFKLLDIFETNKILFFNIFFPSFKYSIIINLLIWHSYLHNYFLQSTF